jgi:hypothetical protein
LVDQLVAYEHNIDQRYYTTRFIDGLRDDIKSVILIQRPVDLDTACVLALLQEEVTTTRRSEARKPDQWFKPKVTLGAVPLLLPPPPRRDKSLGGAASTEQPKTRSVEPPKLQKPDNKVDALEAYR